MEVQQKLEALRNQYNLTLEHNDRVFYNKYLYRLSVFMYRYAYPDIVKVPTVDEWGWIVDTRWRTSFVHTVRRYADKQGDRIRIEHQTLNYYTNDIPSIEKLIKYINRLNANADDPLDLMLDIKGVRYYPGSVLERNIHYRKKRLPYGKYRFQIISERMTSEQYYDWCDWAKQYPGSIRLKHSDVHRKWGTWSGESIGHVIDEKMLQLVQFKLGSNINKIIEFKLRETTENDE
jgi:hypothetical protein